MHSCARPRVPADDVGEPIQSTCVAVKGSELLLILCPCLTDADGEGHAEKTPFYCLFYLLANTTGIHPPPPRLSNNPTTLHLPWAPPPGPQSYPHPCHVVGKVTGRCTAHPLKPIVTQQPPRARRHARAQCHELAHLPLTSKQRRTLQLSVGLD